MSLGVNFNSYSFDKYNIRKKTSINSDVSDGNQNISGREIYVTWRYDEQGNIVYYTFDKNSGELIDTHKYSNPAKL